MQTWGKNPTLWKFWRNLRLPENFYLTKKRWDSSIDVQQFHFWFQTHLRSLSATIRSLLQVEVPPKPRDFLRDKYKCCLLIISSHGLNYFLPECVLRGSKEAPVQLTAINPPENPLLLASCALSTPMLDPTLQLYWWIHKYIHKYKH